MTQEIWDRLPEADRNRLRDTSSLTQQLIGMEHRWVEVVDDAGERRRFKVGRSTGWVPIHLELKTMRSRWGDPAEKHYKSVRIIR